MAKLNKSQKFARSLNNINKMEVGVTSTVKEAILNYHREKSNPAALSFIYTGITLAENLRKDQESSINKFINAFAGVSIKKDVDDKPMKDDQGSVILVKNDSKLTKALTALELNDTDAGEERAVLIEIKIDEWLELRGGNLFGKVRTIREPKTDAEKREAVKDKRVKKLADDINGMDFVRSEKAAMGLDFIKALGFDSIAAFQDALNSATAE